MRPTDASKGLRVRILDRVDMPVKIRSRTGTVTRVRVKIARVFLDVESVNDFGEPVRAIRVRWADVEPEQTADDD